MKNSKLIKLFKTFSKEEWKEFEKFAASSYFNKGRNYAPFIKSLKKFFPEFYSEKLTKENIYKELYKGKKFKDTVINTITTGTYKLAEEFLVQESLKQGNIKKPLLLKELSLRNMKQEVNSLIKKTEELYNSNSIGLSEYYDKQFMYEEMTNHFIRNDDRNKTVDYLNKTFMVTMYYLLNYMIQVQNILHINRNFLKFDYNNNIISKTISFIDLDKLVNLFNETDQQNAIQLIIRYYSFAALSQTDNDDYFYKMKKLMDKYYNNFDRNMKIHTNVA